MVETGAIKKVCAWCINTTYSEEWDIGIFTESIKIRPLACKWFTNFANFSVPSGVTAPVSHIDDMPVLYQSDVMVSEDENQLGKPKEALDFFLQFLVAYPIWVISGDKSMLLVTRDLLELCVI